MPPAKTEILRVRITHATYVRFHEVYRDRRTAKKYRTLEDFLVDLLRMAEGEKPLMVGAIK